MRARPARPTRRSRPFLAPIDGLLVLLTVIWGSNFSVVKLALREIPPLGFNALRLVLASALFLGLLFVSKRRTQPSRREWARLVGLGLVGHFAYQLSFLGGLARTSVANSSLILGCTPIAVALLSVAIGRHERVTGLHWIGVALSVAGIYLVVGRGATLTPTSLVGDALTLVAVWCWAAYTIGAGPLLARHSPLVVTGYSMTLGTILYVPFGLPDLLRLDWPAVSLGAWIALGGSAVFALCVAYLIWYTAVQQIGSARTAVYSNMVPVAAMVVAAVWLNEPIGTAKILGATAILLGLALTRVERPAGPPIPAEE